MNKRDYKDMWVCIEHDGRTIAPVSLELCCEVRRICDEARESLVAVVVGSLPKSEMEKILECGVDKLLHIDGEGCAEFSVDSYTHIFTQLCRKYKPSAVLVGGTTSGRDYAPRFAARLPTGCTSDATELVYDPETTDIEFVEPAVGGKIMAVITVPEMRPQVGTIRPGTFKYSPSGARECKFIEETIDFPTEKIRTRTLSARPNDCNDSLDIASAEVIVCVGNAIKGAEALEKYRRLALLLGGKLGCTRPVFDRGLLPFKLVIGQSGTVVRPRIYIAFGVSGAVNHISGITDSDVIVAVNSDPDAAIFRCCDYGIVGDMDEICLAMLKKLG